MLKGRQEVGNAYKLDDMADQYFNSRYKDPFWHALHKAQVNVLSSEIRSLEPNKILELAPGPGRLTVTLPKVKFSCALEQSEAMLKVASRELINSNCNHWRLVQGDAFDLPFKNDSFDAVVCFKLIRHFPSEMRLRLLSNVRNVLRTGGLLYLDVAHDSQYEWLLQKIGNTNKWIDDYWFKQDSFEKEMQQIGFRVVRMHPIHSFSQFQYFIWTYARRFSPSIASFLSHFLNSVFRWKPLEWIAVCQCE